MKKYLVTINGWKKITETGMKKITKCEICGCKFSYDDKDIDGNRYDGFWVTCPQCHNVTEGERTNGKNNFPCKKES